MLVQYRSLSLVLASFPARGGGKGGDIPLTACGTTIHLVIFLFIVPAGGCITAYFSLLPESSPVQNPGPVQGIDFP